MTRSNGRLVRAFAMGTAASVLSSAALMAAGRRENGAWAAPTNATSQWLHGSESLHVSVPDVRHTVSGYVIHHAMSVMWAAIYDAACRDALVRRGLGSEVIAGLGAAAGACLIDYTVTPRRLTPGFEHRLSKTAMTGVYAMFGLGLGLASWALHRSRR